MCYNAGTMDKELTLKTLLPSTRRVRTEIKLYKQSAQQPTLTGLLNKLGIPWSV